MGYRNNILMLMPKTVWDVDALAFISTASITNSTQKSAINYLVTQLKSNSLWTLIKALYPFVGGTSTTHSYNLKNTATFQITWNGTVTHNSNGITPNGTNGYADTGYIVSSNVSVNSESMGLYSRTSAGSGVAGTAIDMGVVSGGRSLMSIRAATGGDIGLNQMNDSTITSFSATITNGQGLHIISRTASNLLERTQNGVLNSSNSSSNGGGLPTVRNVFIGCRNNSGTATGFVNRNIALGFMASGLSLAQTLTLYGIVQQYQTILGRQV